MRILLETVARNSDHSGLFPAAGGGKIAVFEESLLIAYGDDQGGSTVLRRDGGKGWTSLGRLPIRPPYITVDSGGLVHAAGLHQEKRDEVWYFRSRRPGGEGGFEEGGPIHPRNYSALTADPAGDSIYYFGAAAVQGGLGFLRRKASGPWSKGVRLIEGHVIYPGAVIRDGVIHLVFCGWNPAAAIYENVFYLRSRDGGDTWTRGDGVRVEVPHRHDAGDPSSVGALDRVSRAYGEGGFEASTHGLQVLADRQGRPHVTYFYVPAYFPRAGRFPRTAIVHARREADGWKRSHLSGDPSVDVGWASLVEDERAGTLHAVVSYRESTRRFADLGYTSSRDSGDTWSAIDRVTGDADELRAGYTYPHWASRAVEGKLRFVVNRSGGGPLLVGTLEP